MCVVFHHPPTPSIDTLSLHDALPIFTKNRFTVRSSVTPCSASDRPAITRAATFASGTRDGGAVARGARSEEHTSELQSRVDLVCRLLLEKKKNDKKTAPVPRTVLQYH